MYFLSNIIARNEDVADFDLKRRYHPQKDFVLKFKNYTYNVCAKGSSFNQLKSKKVYLKK